VTTAVRTQKCERVSLVAAATTDPALPGLDRIGTRLACGIREVLGSAGASASVTSAGMKTMRFSDWTATLPPSVAVARYRIDGLKGGMLMALPTGLVAAMVDLFYGGSGNVDGARTEFGAAETRFFARVALRLAEAVAAAWADVLVIAPVVVGHETVAGDVAFGKSADQVIVQRFALAGGPSGECAIELIMALAAIRSVAGLQENADAERPDLDPVWAERMSEAVMQARLPVRTVIARPTVSLQRLLSLAPGDIIPVCLPARVPLTVAGRLLAHGTIGEANGRAAFKIDLLENGAVCND
jgi:flagellar motor switch protein FliM